MAVVLVLGGCTHLAPPAAEPASSGATTATTAAAPIVQATAAPTTAPPVTAPPTTARARPRPADPATVVRRFYAAVNDGDYRTAWELGGRNLGNRSYQEFVAGFADTDHDDLEVTGVRGQSVEVLLVASQDGGTRQTVYAGTYQVAGGAIVHGRLRVVDRSGGATTNACDPSYPDFCIPPPPPDLDCAEIGQQDFTVLPPDPHGFDGDRDGVGCESR
jgi:hypothetical protein